MKYFTLLTALIISFINGWTNGESYAESMAFSSFQETQPEGKDNVIVRDWVDLGLPSGTLWASVPENDYYKWDEAMQIFGVNIPSVWQWKELIDSCSWEDTDNGWLAIGKNGNSIFIPVTGIANNSGKISHPTIDCGFYWSSKRINTKKAYGAYFDSAKSISTIPNQAMMTQEDSNTIRPALIEKQMLCVWLVNK